ncbi:MAG: (Fe-S)-binding protein [Planctomycetota bacterium]
MKVALFVPCYVDQVVPAAAIATTRLLRRLGVEVVYPKEQTCCGQPAFNTGYWPEATELAIRQTQVFLDSGADAVVSPSGSCLAMQRVFYPTLLKGTPHEQAGADLAAKSFELSEFLVDKLGVTDVGARFCGRAVLHKSCHALRELNARTQARQLLEKVKDLELLELAQDEECCGFGGTFAIKVSDISTAMGDIKVENIVASGADWVVSGDASCLMHIGGILERRNLRPKPIHLAEVLAATA